MHRELGRGITDRPELHRQALEGMWHGLIIRDTTFSLFLICFPFSRVVKRNRIERGGLPAQCWWNVIHSKQCGFEHFRTENGTIFLLYVHTDQSYMFIQRQWQNSLSFV